jgi:hypothetical protein
MLLVLAGCHAPGHDRDVEGYLRGSTLTILNSKVAPVATEEVEAAARRVPPQQLPDFSKLYLLAAPGGFAASLKALELQLGRHGFRQAGLFKDTFVFLDASNTRMIKILQGKVPLQLKYEVYREPYRIKPNDEQRKAGAE